MVGKSIALLPNNKNEIKYYVVSEAGASVYSTTTSAKEEYPDVEVNYLGAVSIAKRLMDPLSEVKISKLCFI